MASHVLALPSELRVAVYDYVITSDIVLPGQLPPGVSALLMTSKQTRSEILSRLWRVANVTWEGKLDSRAWHKFRKLAVPYIHNLTIVVQTDFRRHCGLDNYLCRVLQWMCWRSKPGRKAKYPWELEKLTLSDKPRTVLLLPENWVGVNICWACQRKQRWMPSHYEWYLINELRTCGPEVTTELQR